VLQVAAQTGCVAVGVEIRSELTSIGQALLKNYQTLVRAILSDLDKLVRTLRSHRRPALSSCEEPTSCEEKCNSCVGTF
jgi:molybdenum-dependent DNA-binding transcriptional regulator ModE